MEKINEKYYLGSSKNTFILYEKKISASGKGSYKNVGYLPSLDAVYNAILEKEIKENIILLNNIEEIKDMIEELKKFTVKYTEKSNIS